MSAAKSSCFRKLGLSLVCFAILTTAGLAQGPGGAVLPSERSLNRFGLELAWWNHATLQPSRDRVGFFTTDEEISYVQSRSGLVTAFDNTTGRKLWSLQLGRTDSVSFPAVSNDEIVIIAAGSTLYAVKRWSGDLAWEVPVPKPPSASPSVDDRQVYVGSLDGTVVALDLAKLSRYYQQDLLPRWANMTPNWRTQTGSEITTPAVTSGIVVNVACRDGSLYGLSTGERKIRFQFETDAPISAPLGYAAGNLFLASEDFNVYCINAENGVIRWEFVSGLPIRKVPQVIGRHVYLLPDKGGMYCLASADGSELWWNPKVTNFLAATSTLIYASDEAGNILLLRRDDGAILGSLPLREFDVRISNDRTDRLFLANRSGLVLCLREQNRTFPLYHKYPDRQPVLPEMAPEVPSVGSAANGDAEPKPDSTPATGKN